MNVLSLAWRAAKYVFLGDSGGSSVTGSIASTVGKVAESNIEAGTEQAQAQASENANVRAFAAPGVHNSVFDVLVDAANRLIRPVVTTYTFGGIVGWWHLPDLAGVDQRWLYAGSVMLTFWFGGRLLTKDLPSAVLSILRAVGK